MTQLQILAYCTDALAQVLHFNQTLFCLAKWAFILAGVMAVASTVLDLVIKWKAAKVAAAAPDKEVVLKGILPITPDMFKVLTAFVESLAKLPVWFALFLGGMALVWLTTVNVPSVCKPVAVRDGLPVGKQDAPPPAPVKDAPANGAHVAPPAAQ